MMHAFVEIVSAAPALETTWLAELHGCLQYRRFSASLRSSERNLFSETASIPDFRLGMSRSSVAKAPRQQKSGGRPIGSCSRQRFAKCAKSSKSLDSFEVQILAQVRPVRPLGRALGLLYN